MYSNQLQPALQNLLQCVVRFFHRRSSCTTTHVSADVQRITLNVSRMTILGERTEQPDIFCHVTGFTSDFLSFIDVELIRFFLSFEPFNYSLAAQIIWQFHSKTRLTWFNFQFSQRNRKFATYPRWMLYLGHIFCMDLIFGGRFLK